MRLAKGCKRNSAYLSLAGKLYINKIVTYFFLRSFVLLLFCCHSPLLRTFAARTKWIKKHQVKGMNVSYVFLRTHISIIDSTSNFAIWSFIFVERCCPWQPHLLCVRWYILPYFIAKQSADTHTERDRRVYHIDTRTLRTVYTHLWVFGYCNVTCHQPPQLCKSIRILFSLHHLHLPPFFLYSLTSSSRICTVAFLPFNVSAWAMHGIEMWH